MNEQKPKKEKTKDIRIPTDDPKTQVAPKIGTIRIPTDEIRAVGAKLWQAIISFAKEFKFAVAGIVLLWASRYSANPFLYASSVEAALNFYLNPYKYADILSGIFALLSVLCFVLWAYSSTRHLFIKQPFRMDMHLVLVGTALILLITLIERVLWWNSWVANGLLILSWGCFFLWLLSQVKEIFPSESIQRIISECRLLIVALILFIAAGAIPRYGSYFLAGLGLLCIWQYISKERVQGLQFPDLSAGFQWTSLFLTSVIKWIAILLSVSVIAAAAIIIALILTVPNFITTIQHLSPGAIKEILEFIRIIFW